MKKKKPKDKPAPLSKLESEVAKNNPEFVKWLKSRKRKAVDKKEG